MKSMSSKTFKGQFNIYSQILNIFFHIMQIYLIYRAREEKKRKVSSVSGAWHPAGNKRVIKYRSPSRGIKQRDIDTPLSLSVSLYHTHTVHPEGLQQWHKPSHSCCFSRNSLPARECVAWPARLSRFLGVFLHCVTLISVPELRVWVHIPSAEGSKIL